MDKGLLDPGASEMDDYKEEKKMDEGYDEEGEGSARVLGQPEGEGKSEEHEHGDEDEDEEDCQGSRRQQADHLVNHIELHIFGLKPEVMFQDLNQLGKCLNVLVA